MSLSTINREQTITTSLFQLNTNTVNVFLSDAEAQVIKSKARKAGISVNEYIRNAALGFPMG